MTVENVITIELDSEAGRELAAAFANDRTYKVSLNPRADGVAIKVNEGMWTIGLDTGERTIAFHVRDNITGQRVSQDFETEDQANGVCRSLNTPAAGGLYGVYDTTGARR